MKTTEITNNQIELAAEYFAENGWTEMEAEIWAAFEAGDNGTMFRLVSHYRAHVA
jgi:hypothetical protein